MSRKLRRLPTSLQSSWARPLAFALGVAITLLACKVRAQPPLPREVGRIELPGVSGRLDHLAIDSEGRRVYIAALGADKGESEDVTGFEGGRRIGAVGGLPDADNLRSYAPTGQLFAGYGSGLVAIDPNSIAIGQRIALPGHPEAFELAERGAEIYVNVPSAGLIVVVDRRTGKMIAEWRIAPDAANFPMALDEAVHRLYVGTRRPAKLIASTRLPVGAFQKHRYAGMSTIFSSIRGESRCWLSAARVRMVVVNTECSARSSIFALGPDARFSSSRMTDFASMTLSRNEQELKSIKSTGYFGQDPSINLMRLLQTKRRSMPNSISGFVMCFSLCKGSELMFSRKTRSE